MNTGKYEIGKLEQGEILKQREIKQKRLYGIYYWRATNKGKDIK